MPTLASSRLPPPTNWDDFEDITRDALCVKWNSPTLQRHGRQGQKQQGVDVFGPDDLGRQVGVQCKETATEIDIIVVKKEIAKAETFTPTIAAFYMATTSPRDANLQREVRVLSADRVGKGQFPCGIFFWDDLISDLIRNRDFVQKHYPGLGVGGEPAKDTGPRLLGLLDIAYFGRRVKYFMALLFGEFGLIAREQDQFIDLITDVRALARHLLDAESSEIVKAAANGLLKDTMEIATNPDGPLTWDRPNRSASMIDALVGTLEVSLAGRELAIFTVGTLLGRWDVALADDKPLADVAVAQIKASLEVAFPQAESADLITEIMTLVDEGQSPQAPTMSIYNAGKAYNAVRRTLRIQQMAT